ncbi:AzlC family ABC transporter permease [Canibacter zhoujuaniae]|uniref:AzlC family ABC transporter permease n=1 Tax=Canibacter zhoujuaniae TaxID=2708343 RepID=UPI00142414D8|nr:AzlC family ABC transporter permease [Canibacter zhoujuaniae]
MTETAQFKLGFQDSLSVGLGIFPLGIALGMLAIELDLQWWVAPLTSLVVYAGSVEFMLLSLFASDASLLTIAALVFAINFRHVFYAFSFPLHLVKNPVARFYSVFGLIDEVYATYAGKDTAELTGTRVVTMQVISHLYWLGGSLLGVVIASALPVDLHGFEFALCALFTVMFIDAFSSRRQLPSSVLAGIAVTAGMLMPGDFDLLLSLLIFAALLAVRAVFNYRSAKGPALGGEV